MPLPVLRRTLTVFEPQFATIMSGLLSPLTSAAATDDWATASCIGRLSRKGAVACVEKNTNGVRTPVCDNNVGFVVAIDIGCCHRVWVTASCIGRLIRKGAVACVEKNTDGVRTIVCDNNVGFVVAIDIGCCHKPWVTASCIGRLSSEQHTASNYLQTKTTSTPSHQLHVCAQYSSSLTMSICTETRYRRNDTPKSEQLCLLCGESDQVWLYCNRSTSHIPA